MDTANFDWDEANISHIAEHNVAPEEAEEVLLGNSFEVGFDVVNHEERWVFIGETNSERILRVVMAVRNEKIRVVTAFEPSKRAKMLYLARKASEK
ncbi:MAG TPA: BrnT family toxin [Terracidiphilus sp.]|nr:BrnT family toxin [Terracidiphilus sp.]